ncbi:MAG: ABC transporter permease, partial [Candidatus Thermoplasmatota archaeon]
KARYDATEKGTRLVTFEVPALFDARYKKGVYAVLRHMNGTAGDLSDDFSWLYRFTDDSLRNDTYNLRMQLDGRVYGSLSMRHDMQDVQHLYPTIWLGATMGDGSGMVYAYSCAGEYLAPLPPTWLLPEKDRPKSGNYYWLGTDTQGRDILSQVIWGSQIALLVGFAAAFFSILIGVIIGLVSGYYGGKVDIVLMRFTDVILVLPGLPILIVLAALLGPSLWNIVIIIAVVGWGSTARIIRAETLSLKERPFIDSARVTGASRARIMFKHIAPNVMPLAFLYMVFYVSGAILSEAALSFIGLGDPRSMSWGMMLNYVQHANALTNWWWLLPPGLCITFVCLSFFLLGRAFDEVVNPRLRRRR